MNSAANNTSSQPQAPRTGLFIELSALMPDDDAMISTGAAAVIRRMNLAAVPVVVFGAYKSNSAAAAHILAGLTNSLPTPSDPDLDVAPVIDLHATANPADPQQARCLPPKPFLLLNAAQTLAIDLASSWVVSSSHAAIKAAEQAGCYGAVLVGDSPEPEGFLAIRLARASDLADAPRVMVPDDGGCWHDHR